MAKTRNFCLNTAEAVDYSVIPRYDAESRNARKSAVTGPRIMCGVTCRAEAVDIGTECRSKSQSWRQSLNTAEAVDIGTWEAGIQLLKRVSQYRRSSRHRYHNLNIFIMNLIEVSIPPKQ